MTGQNPSHFHSRHTPSTSSPTASLLRWMLSSSWTHRLIPRPRQARGGAHLQAHRFRAVVVAVAGGDASRRRTWRLIDLLRTMPDDFRLQEAQRESLTDRAPCHRSAHAPRNCSIVPSHLRSRRSSERGRDHPHPRATGGPPGTRTGSTPNWSASAWPIEMQLGRSQPSRSTSIPMRIGGLPTGQTPVGGI